mgnify:FL=1
MKNALHSHRIGIQPLKGHGAFDLVFEHGARFAYRGVTGFLLFRHTLQTSEKSGLSELDRFRAVPADTLLVGVSAKRRTRPAVMRNRIKRLLRTSVQKALWDAGSLPFDMQREPCPIVAIVLICNIVPAKPSLLHLTDIQPLVERIFQNADKHFRSKHHPSN